MLYIIRIYIYVCVCVCVCVAHDTQLFHDHRTHFFNFWIYGSDALCPFFKQRLLCMFIFSNCVYNKQCLNLLRLCPELMLSTDGGHGLCDVVLFN